jgi:hypothetical protein
MPTPKQGYTLADGTKIPGTTTVLGTSLGWSKGPLMKWAHRMGLEGKELYGERDAAAEIGTIAHEAAECHIKGREFVMPDLPEEAAKKVRSAFSAYLEWREDSRIEVVSSEIAYVSEQFKYGGTLDGIGRKGSRKVLIDFKTSNGTYAEHLIQLAAYHHLDLESTGEPFERWHLLRFGKERGDFHHHSYQPIPEAWEAFKHLRALYDLKRPLEQLA